ncbi:MAG: DUF2079 domain-containing protein [Actinomycetota bacterium]|nr:DUF2079 domain-containing protein [Actinomycetota bacterium]
MLHARKAITPAILAVVFGALYAALSLVRYHRFDPSSWDNAIFEQGIMGYAHFGAPIVDIKGPGFNQLGDHFSPIIALVAPFYRVFPSAQTVLISQAVLIAISVAVIAHVAIRHLGQIRGIAITIAYGLSFGIQSAVQSDFHEVAFAAPLLALAGAAYVDRDWRRVVWWTLPLMLVKEDMGITVAAIGAVLWLAGERRRGTVLAAIGVLGMALVLFVVIPHFNPAGEWDYATKFGGDRSVLDVALDQPGRKLLTVVLTVGVTGFLAMASPWILLALPILAGRFVADKEYYWGTDWHYSLVLMPIVFIALIDAMNREHRNPWLRAYAAQGAAVAIVFAAAMQAHSPLSVLVKPSTYDPNPRAASAREAISLVPKGTSVETDIGLMTHLVTDHKVFWLGTADNPRPDYVLFDIDSNLGSPVDAVGYAQGIHGGDWKLVLANDGYILAKSQ